MNLLNLSQFEGYTRVRVSSILIVNQNILLLQQKSILHPDIHVWMPPGGGLNFQETLMSAVVRETHEETNLVIIPEKLLYIHEFIQGRFHAVEFYFLVTCEHPEQLTLGSDPELLEKEQLIVGMDWVSLNLLPQINFYPEKLKAALLEDMKNGFSQPPRQL